ncbi:shugoshin-1 isoform X2 [Impatiens glandulifera]|uniref:shugoshin-1 isoform X2 n=1 Tax=Impatiens glandulifera TaxID=253017 RepID=UPI001FB07D44|nr:shugoshin-1 isoform X2 [Impatiens glandulifera]
MSIAEASSRLDSQNTHVGAKSKIEKEDNGNAQRRILGDISNLVQKPNQLPGNGKMQQTSNSTKDYINQLEKENMALQKLIAENKLVERMGLEKQALRINMQNMQLQKLQMQNMQLAQSNSQMLKELNLVKDRLKIIQHELGCKNGIIAAQKLELKPKDNTMACQIVVNEVGGTSTDKIVHESSEANRVEIQPSNMNRKLRSKSVDSSAAQKDDLKEKPKSKRVCLRRQSVRLKHEDTEDLFEIHDAKFPICSLSDDEPSDKKEQVSQECSNFATGDDNTRESRRSSLGRPLRSAANKIMSYKEIPLNTKMRR